MGDEAPREGVEWVWEGCSPLTGMGSGEAR